MKRSMITVVSVIASLLLVPSVLQGVGIAVFDNAAVWPYNDTGLTDDLDYLGHTYTKYTPANVANLFVSTDPDDAQPIYDYNLLMVATVYGAVQVIPTIPSLRTIATS